MRAEDPQRGYLIHITGEFKCPYCGKENTFIAGYKKISIKCNFCYKGVNIETIIKVIKSTSTTW